jgi:hypothetical protein
MSERCHAEYVDQIIKSTSADEMQFQLSCKFSNQTPHQCL